MFRFARSHPFFILFLVLVAAGVSWAVARHRQPKLLDARVQAIDTVDELQQIVSASGEIQSHDEVDIQTEYAGVIVDLPVIEGQVLKKGDVLLKIDDFSAQTELAASRARYQSAVADVAKARVTIAMAQAALITDQNQLRTTELSLKESIISAERAEARRERQEKLFERGAISAEEYDVVESEARLAKMRCQSGQSRIEELKAKIESSKLLINQHTVTLESMKQSVLVSSATLQRTEDTLQKLTITSPLDGIIVRLNVDIGERAVPGIQSNPQATLMTIANLSHIEALLEVDETDIVDIKLGHLVEITVDALSDNKLKGHVTEISMAPILQSAGQQEGKDFEVVVTLDDTPETLRMGMSCEADITVATRTNVIAAPIQALTDRDVPVDDDGNYLPPPKPLEGKKKSGTPKEADNTNKTKMKEMTGVFILDKDGFARFRPIKTGIMGESSIEILEGLSVGEEVVIGPLETQRKLEEWKRLRKLETDQ